jgi:predicted transcriptional regulator of viral defense system
MSEQLPHEIYLALPRGAERPRLDYPPLRTFWFSGSAFTEGIEVHQVDHMALRVYNREKTLADCFKYRNSVGLDTTLEALRVYKQQDQLNVQKLMHYAKVCRVAKVMRPYLESILSQNAQSRMYRPPYDNGS